jgi:AraC-like DNA-binding protein
MWSPLERLEAGEVARHRHGQSYAAFVVRGSYEEAGDAGRYAVRPGDLLVHRAYEAHRNVVAASGAVVINLPIAETVSLPRAFRVSDPDMLLRAADHDPAALSCLLQPAALIAPRFADWPDQLAIDIAADPALCLGQWAALNGLAAATVSRGFRKVFGVSPARFRAEARARSALAAVENRATPLAALAHDLGFADQAHMTRAVRALSGVTPGRWRQVKSVQS